jgi:hypothetical protein
MPIDQEVLDFGMDAVGFDNGVVTGLKTGSRAKAARLKEGDRIISNLHLRPCVDNFDAKMEVTIRRDEENKTLKYWPRSLFDEEKSWPLMKLDKIPEVSKDE